MSNGNGADQMMQIANRMHSNKHTYKLKQFQQSGPGIFVEQKYEKKGLEALWDPSEEGRELHLYDNVK